jgi:endonuclease YncB( thermonuclease family)
MPDKPDNMRKYLLFFVVLVAVVLQVAPTDAQTMLPGKVVDVLDGKTIAVALSTGEVKVELEYIDVPEPGHLLSGEIREHLRTLVFGKAIEYRPRFISKDRTTGTVLLNGVNISEQMLRDGAAWHIPSQLTGQEQTESDIYAAMEAVAKGEKRGVWAIPGLKPYWEAAKQHEEQSSIVSDPDSMAPISYTAVKSNPAFGDVGALINRFDPESGTGVLSTSFMPIGVPQDFRSVEKMAIDVSYYYKEDDKKGRKGTFVVTVAFLSQKTEFLTNNELLIWNNGKVTHLGKPKRISSNRSDGVHETLMYGISRNILERAADDGDVYFKVGHEVIQLTGGRYLLYNLLQVTRQN